MKYIFFLLLSVFGVQIAAQAQVITTVAGGGLSVPGDGGPATNCTLIRPSALTVDAAAGT